MGLVVAALITADDDLKEVIQAGGGQMAGQKRPMLRGDEGQAYAAALDCFEDFQDTGEWTDGVIQLAHALAVGLDYRLQGRTFLAGIGPGRRQDINKRETCRFGPEFAAALDSQVRFKGVAVGLKNEVVGVRHGAVEVKK